MNEGYCPEPFRIKMVEPIRATSREERQRLIAAAGYNPFLLRSEDVYIDLLTDSGTGAMSDRQWSGLMRGDEAYAGSRSFLRLKDTVERLMGFPHLIPTHQGRAAEHILFRVMVKPGQIVPNNMHFDTTRAHVLNREARPVDLAPGVAYRPSQPAPFKGDMDVAQLEALLARHGPDDVPLILVTVTNNTAGGQPVSLANLRSVRQVADRYGIPLILDAARIAENAYFIQQREPEHSGRSVAEIVRAMCDLADGCTMSAKKDGLANIGGFLALRDERLYRQAIVWAVLFEGFPTYGGLAGRDLEAIATGLEEVVDEGYLAYRVGQVEYLAARLRESGVPIVEPPGGHGVFVDARAFLPHIPPAEYPAWALTVALYEEAGIRAVEIGTVLAGRDPDSGADRLDGLDLVRLAIPRRVYTQAHLDQVAQAFRRLAARRDRIPGYRLVEEPPVLRHFTCRMEPVWRQAAHPNG